MIDIKAPPVKGKANSQIVKFLKRNFSSPVSIIKGHKSHIKIIKIGNTDINKDKIQQILKI